MQPADDQETIKQLQQAISKDDSGSIYQLSSSLLRNHPDDLDYKQCYALSAIKLRLFNELSDGLFREKPADKRLQSIYYHFLYSAGHINKCIEQLSGAKEPSLQLLLAQSHFKAMNYQESARITADLLKSAKLSQDEKQTYLINILAASRPSDSYHRDFESLINERTCKEIFYNLALSLFQRGQSEQANKYLSLFQKGLDKNDEIDWLTVRLFQDYMHYHKMRAGDVENPKKQEEYHGYIKTIKDPNLRCVAQTNLGFFNPNEAESIKMIDQFLDPSFKCSWLQSSILKANKVVLLLRKNRVPEAVKLLREIEPSFGSENREYERSKYLALKKSKDQNIEKYIKEVSGSDPLLGFCLMADLALENNDHKRILQTLQDKELSSNETIKNFIFSLLIQNQSLFENFSEYLDELIHKSTEVEILEVLLKLYESKGDTSKQSLILKRILEVNPKNSTAKVGLAEKYLKEGNVEAAELELRGIEGPEEITDINFLQYIEKNIHVSKKEDEKVPEIDSKKAGHKKRIKKKKRVRLPKTAEKFVEGYKDPDNERWLPKWQRKGYKKRGGKKGGGKTQGLSTVGMEEKNTFFSGNSTSSKEVTKEQKRRR